MIMHTPKLPFTEKELSKIIEQYPTPFHIYIEKAIRENIRKLLREFDWAPGFKEYFAVKATPNPRIMSMLREEGCGFDCSSLPELLLAERVGSSGEEIMFSSNDTPAEEFKKARRLGAVINLDDISHIDFLEKHADLPELVCFRYNPGPLKEGNAIIGKPEEAKYGFTREQLFSGYTTLRERGVNRFGLHTMVASNELDYRYFIETARMLFQLAVELSDKYGIKLEFVNLGGGIGIPYKPDEKPVDLARLSAGIREAYREMIEPAGLDPLKIYMENGRVVTGPYGFLVSRVLHLKNTYRKYVGLDANMANLMRPALYGAYHEITVVGKEEAECEETYDVVGSLCENNDKFAINRQLPLIDQGDIVVIHNTGAHGHAMGFNYNGKLRSAELLLRENGEVELIRRAETVEDYFATLNL